MNKSAEKLQWDPLSDEELKFCWHCLVDQGQLTTSKLQKFMLEVTGDELTAIQATDLLGYLDATGDGRVGMEEFRHFMSSSELDMTDVQTFLWSPTKSFRERLGLVRVALSQEKAPDPGARDFRLPGFLLTTCDLHGFCRPSMVSQWSQGWGISQFGTVHFSMGNIGKNDCQSLSIPPVAGSGGLGCLAPYL